MSFQILFAIRAYLGLFRYVGLTVLAFLSFVHSEYISPCIYFYTLRVQVTRNVALCKLKLCSELDDLSDNGDGKGLYFAVGIKHRLILTV